MTKSTGSIYLALVVLLALLSGCAPAATPVPATPTMESTETPIPSPTPLPGIETSPLDAFAKSIPWLPMQNSARPGTYYFLFNLSKPPFTNVLVRQAFAASVDRGAIVNIALQYGATNPRPATTFTPPETLGRDLYNAVGVSFLPSHARELLTQAGYTDLSKFPPVTLITNPGKDGVNAKIGEELVRMWQIHLGVTVTLEVVSKNYFDRLQTDPTEIYFQLWAADYNDPDDFLLENFHTGSQYNYNHFSNLDFDKLVDLAASSHDPVVRQELYIQAERILCETEAAVIPIYHATYDIP